MQRFPGWYHCTEFVARAKVQQYACDERNQIWTSYASPTRMFQVLKKTKDNEIVYASPDWSQGPDRKLSAIRRSPVANGAAPT